MKDILKRIAERWFLREPAFFALYCIQTVDENTQMKCGFRCTKNGLEYNPKKLRYRNSFDIEMLLRVELIRMFLKHPYERQPENCSNQSKAIGSDCAIYSNYRHDGRYHGLRLFRPDLFNLIEGEAYEWYARIIEDLLPTEGMKEESDDDLSFAIDSDSTPGDADSDETSKTKGKRSHSNDTKGGEEEETEDSEGTADSEADEETEGNDTSEESESKESIESIDQITDKMLNEASDLAAEWEEDDMKAAEINDLIEKIKDWGSIPGDMVQHIIASTKARIDYRKVIQGFRGSILSSNRRLTRMRPNRRVEFEQMGNIRKFTTGLLVAVDVSGSVTEQTLSNFYSVINRFFRYGIDKIDVVQFDCDLGPVTSFNHAKKEITVVGRGGTDYQPVFDYVAEHPEYDGLVILTDGYADRPKVSETMRTKVLWVCEDEKLYFEHKDWMETYGRVCWMYL